jgi:hypothetical protein
LNTARIVGLAMRLAKNLAIDIVPLQSRRRSRSCRDKLALMMMMMGCLIKRRNRLRKWRIVSSRSRGRRKGYSNVYGDEKFGGGNGHLCFDGRKGE